MMIMMIIISAKKEKAFTGCKIKGIKEKTSTYLL